VAVTDPPTPQFSGPPQATADVTVHIADAVDSPRVGELTSGWRVVVVLTWVAVVLAWSAVWSVSVQLGHPTWWLGTRATPTSPLIRLAPFVGPVAIIIGAIVNLRRLAWLGVAAALVFGAYGIGDLGGRARLGLVEVAIAAAALVVSLAALTGTYRAARPVAEPVVTTRR